MTADAIIDEIRKLPPEEKDKVVRFLRVGVETDLPEPALPLRKAGLSPGAFKVAEDFDEALPESF